MLVVEVVVTGVVFEVEVVVVLDNVVVDVEIMVASVAVVNPILGGSITQLPALRESRDCCCGILSIPAVVCRISI